jgi:predicted SnoaL-like aldol condensation-catalyzing enzyme
MSDSSLSANKALVLKALTGLFNDRDLSLLDTIFAPDYIQHNPTVPTGRAGLKEIAPHLSPDLHYTPGMIVAEGNHVMVHGRYVGWGPKPVVGVDIFRISNGVLVEHWDVLQEEVPATQTKSGNAMFDPQETA